MAGALGRGRRGRATSGYRDPSLPRPASGTCPAAQVSWMPGPGRAVQSATASTCVRTAGRDGSSLQVTNAGGGSGANPEKEQDLERTWPWSSALPLWEVSRPARLICKMKSLQESSQRTCGWQLFGLEKTLRPVAERHNKRYQSAARASPSL